MQTLTLVVPDLLTPLAIATRRTRLAKMMYVHFLLRPGERLILAGMKLILVYDSDPDFIEYKPIRKVGVLFTISSAYGTDA